MRKINPYGKGSIKNGKEEKALNPKMLKKKRIRIHIYICYITFITS